MTTSDHASGTMADDDAIVGGPHTARPVRVRTEGDHQVVELPVDVQVIGDVMYLDSEVGGRLVLTSTPPSARSWDELFALIDEAGPAHDDFMADRPLNTPTRDRNVFDEPA